MSDARRESARRAFLATTQWRDANRSRLAGDASSRRYFRLVGPAGSVILMDAPPDKVSNTAAFLDVATILSGHGLSAPKIIASDVDSGFLLLEDFGDDLFSAVLDCDPTMAKALYARAVDVLIHLARADVPRGVPVYSAEYMADQAVLPYAWYADGDKSALKKALELTLEPVLQNRRGLILRDFFADNLVWLPARDGLASVGLLDFQDAAICHPVYDLISLLRDVRRDVPDAIRADGMARFGAALGIPEDDLARAAATLSVQRNLRILGVFARLSRRDGKRGYLRHVPRVWSLLIEDLEHPALAEVRDIVVSTLPAPSPQVIEGLR